MNVFVASTPYHLLISCSMKKENDYLLVEKNEVIKSKYIENIIKKYFNENLMIIDNHSMLFGKITAGRKTFSKINKILDKQKVEKIYAFNDADPIVQYLFHKYHKRCKNIILEEGIGLYNTMYHNYRILKQVYGKIFFGNWYKIEKRIGEYKYTNSIYARNKQLLNEKQLKKEVIIYNYDELKEMIKNERINKKKNVWFLGQPLVEDGICTEEEYFKCLRKCIEISKRNGKELIVKVHPREETQKYKKIANETEIYQDKEIPFELVIDNNFNTLVLTISSSSILNLKNNLNVRSCFLFKMVDTKISFSTEVIYQSNATIIENWEELEEIFRSN